MSLICQKNVEITKKNETIASITGEKSGVPVKNGWLLLLDVVGWHITGHVALVADAPPMFGVVQELQPLVLPEVELVASLCLVVVLGNHPHVLHARFT